MSKIFDALKKADHLRSEGVADAVLDEPVCNPPGISVAEAEPEPIPNFVSAGTQTIAPAHATLSNETGSTERIFRLKISADSPVFPFEDLHSRAAEQYRIIRTKILHHPLQPRVIVVSSASSGDGKTVTAINLAAVLALKKDVRVLLVDADLRRRDIHKLLGIPETSGLSDVLSGASGLDESLVQLEQFPNLCVLPAGTIKRNPAELLEQKRWRDLVADCRHRFTHIIIDATPMAAVTDFDLVQLVCDGVVLVVRPDHTDRKACLKALETVAKEKMIGTIVNCLDDWFLWKPVGSESYYYR
jgi:protein-tyrosine kinase